MQFEPKKESEVSAYGMLEAGIYDFEIVKAEDQTSKAGNDMIKVVLKVFGNDGTNVIMSDYLLSDESMAYKLRHCCASIGILEKYEGGDLIAGDFVTGEGKVKLKVEKGKKKDDESGEFYPDRNAVVDYIPQRTDAEAKTVEQNHGIKASKKVTRTKRDLDDEIPF